MKAMKFFRRVVKVLAIAVLTVVGIVVAYALVGTILLLIPVNPVNRQVASDGGIVVYLEKGNNVHADIVVPTRTERIDWSTLVPPGDTKDGVGKEYIAFGWGSRDFYLNVPKWEDLTPGIALKAISGTGGTALHTWYEDEPDEGEGCHRLVLTPAQYNELVEYILASGKRTGDGAFVRIDHPGDGSSDAFYEGTGHYSPFRTCNTWANSALKACGQRCCLWTPIHQPIFWKYQQDTP